MKKIVLFSRVELVHLYGNISPYLSGSYEIIHLAYSDTEENILREKYNIKQVINFKKEIAKLYEEERLDSYLCSKIDQLIISQTDNRFCLNSSIQSDRSFQKIPYSESLLLAQVYYKFWNRMLAQPDIHYLLHEVTALYFIHIASVICKRNGIRYLTHVQVRGEKQYSWIFAEGDDGRPVEMESILKSVRLKDSDKIRVDSYLAKFRKESAVLFQELAKKKTLGDKNFFRFLNSTSRFVIKHLLRKFRNEKKSEFKSYDHVEIFLLQNRPGFLEEYRRRWDEFFYLEFDEYDPEQEYYFYPMHVEPEAVVLYWGDGLYKNQVKLIENVAAQLPPNCFLYVKVHPLDKANRDYIDYKRIKEIPNVKLLGPGVPSKLLIENSKGVITINGTSGFEAILLNKPIYTFGNSIYGLSDRVHMIKNIRDLRQQLYLNHNKTYQDDEALYKFLIAFLESNHEGFTLYFRNLKDVFKFNIEENAKQVAEGMMKSFNIIDSR